MDVQKQVMVLLRSSVDRSLAPAWARSTSACSSFGSPRKDEGGEIQTLHFLSGPRCFPQKVQAGFHGRVALETLNFNSGGEFVPAVVINKLHDHTLKRDAMEGVLRLLAIHTCRPSFARWFLNAQLQSSPAAMECSGIAVRCSALFSFPLIRTVFASFQYSPDMNLGLLTASQGKVVLTKFVAAFRLLVDIKATVRKNNPAFTGLDFSCMQR